MSSKSGAGKSGAGKSIEGLRREMLADPETQRRWLKSEPQRAFADTLLEMRARAHLSQPALAAHIQSDERTIAGIESATAKFDAAMVRDAAAYIEVCKQFMERGDAPQGSVSSVVSEALKDGPMRQRWEENAPNGAVTRALYDVAARVGAKDRQVLAGKPGLEVERVANAMGSRSTGQEAGVLTTLFETMAEEYDCGGLRAPLRCLAADVAAGVYDVDCPSGSYRLAGDVHLMLGGVYPVRDDNVDAAKQVLLNRADGMLFRENRTPS